MKKSAKPPQNSEEKPYFLRDPAWYECLKEGYVTLTPLAPPEAYPSYFEWMSEDPSTRAKVPITPKREVLIEPPEEEEQPITPEVVEEPPKKREPSREGKPQKEDYPSVLEWIKAVVAWKESKKALEALPTGSPEKKTIQPLWIGTKPSENGRKKQKPVPEEETPHP